MDFFDRLARAIDPEAFGDRPDHARQQAARDRLREALADLAPHYEVVRKPDPVRGAPYVTADYGDRQGGKLALSKASLGRFLHALLRHGGTVTSTHALSRTVQGAYVQASVRIPEAAVAAFEAESGVRLCNPPTISLSGSRVST
jgi:hypothetical protein